MSSEMKGQQGKCSVVHHNQGNEIWEIPTIVIIQMDFNKYNVIERNRNGNE